MSASEQQRLLPLVLQKTYEKFRQLWDCLWKLVGLTFGPPRRCKKRKTYRCRACGAQQKKGHCCPVVAKQATKEKRVCSFGLVSSIFVTLLKNDKGNSISALCGVDFITIKKKRKKGKESWGQALQQLWQRWHWRWTYWQPHCCATSIDPQFIPQEKKIK